ncbi:MAG: NAD(P)/FAD-dependent oxidoreductase [Alphaproteobacteria bacterium]|nr:NAD(P)/FAD-dependent oxidoreductase [Alphaproteobacteria bacterium]
MSSDRLDMVVVGAGFAGLAMLHAARALGLAVRVVEAGGGVGGTWFWNRYPGARCDVESMEYSYQFSEALQQDWVWHERYAAQPEILAYAEHVADRFDLRRDIQFDTRVVSAAFDEDRSEWRVTTTAGETLRTRFMVMATGCLSVANRPDLPGLGRFRGPRYHTGDWPHEGVDFSGLRVGIIGTGSSAVQAIPVIAERADHLTVFQRTATYTVPAHNRPLPPAESAAIKADYATLRARAKRTFSGIDIVFNEAEALAVTPAARQREYEARWAQGGIGFIAAFADLLRSAEANATAAQFVRDKIGEVVRDPAVAERLAPRHVIGCKRLCLDTGYWRSFNQPNVTLVDIAENPIAGVVEGGIVAGGRTWPLDAIVLATGFDAMTGALNRIDIGGIGGLKLAQKWAAGPRTYLGLAIAGFPNLFTVTGPGSPSVLTNMLPTIEQHVEWIAACVAHVGARGARQIAAEPGAEDAWVAHNAEVASRTLRSTCASWYVGANVPGKPRVFMPYIGGFPTYVKACAAIAAEGYAGFHLS